MNRFPKPCFRPPLQIPRLVGNKPFAQHSFVQPRRSSNPKFQKNIIQHQSLDPNATPVQVPQSDPNPFKNNSSPVTNIASDIHDFDSCLNLFLKSAQGQPIHIAIESFFKTLFGTQSVYYWEEIVDVPILYSISCGITTPHSAGIVGSCLFSRSIINSSHPTTLPSFNSEIDGQFINENSYVLVFPLWNSQNSICGVVEIIRNPPSPEFSNDDEVFVNWFIEHFKLLSHWMIPSPAINLLPFILEITDLQRGEQFLNSIPQRIANYFDCRQCEIWRLDTVNDQITRFGTPNIKVGTSEGGIVGEVLLKRQPIHLIHTRLSPSYNPKVDGDIDESILVVPILPHTDDKTLTYAIALRGASKGIFSSTVNSELTALAPFVLQTLTNADTYSAVDDEFEKSQLESNGFAGLLEVLGILSQQLETNNLIDIIMEKGRSIIDADRCSLFLLNEDKTKLISHLHQGLDSPIELSLGNGIAGQTLSEGKVMNIPDAYECSFFNRSIDLESGYHTKSILSVPISNYRGEIIGVTEMVNKKGAKTFSEWDIKLIQVFNVFAGISLDNAKLYEEQQHMTNQLRSFFDISFSLAKTEDVKTLLEDILGNARKTVGASRASIFILDETVNCFNTFIAETSGDKHEMPHTLPLNSGLVSACAKSKNGIIENDVYHNPNFNRSIDFNTGYKTISILASPIMSKSGKLLGVAEMLNKVNKDTGKAENFNEKDLNILNAFSAFSSVAIENSRLKDIVQFGDVEFELIKWVGESERDTYEIPVKLVLPEEKQRKILSLNCFSVDFIGIDHFRELFFFFNHFHLLETFKITNSEFFRFIDTISRTYNNPPYHNWTHACDVTQYASYEIEKGNLTKFFTSFEIFALLISCICHDANHEGFNNIYNVKAETPLGILFKDQSVMEMHHITVAIPIILQDKINIFKSFDAIETKRIWNLFIKLILATDMSKHFELVKSAQEALDQNRWDINNPEQHELALKLLLKVADISNVSRPFEIADKWCDILNDEFFRQGDLEKSSGIGLTSPMNDREHPNKPKSQIGFYNFICIPLYQAVARIFPLLQVNLDSLKSNLGVWMEMAAQNKASEEAK